MPISLPNTTVQDAYPPPGGTGAQVRGTDVFWSGYFVVANASVVAQYFYGTQGFDKDSPEFFLAPGNYPIQGNDANPLNGIRFRNGVPGTPAQVFGAFFYKIDPTIQLSSEFLSTVAAGGGITPPVSGLNITYATTLPAGSDGALVVLVDSLTNPSYQFLLRFNAGSTSPYKWECIGPGGALEGTTTITIPNAGDWYVEIGGRGLVVGATGNDERSLTLTAGGITLQASQGQGAGQNNNDDSSAFDRGRMNGLTAAQVLTPTISGSAPTRQFIRAIPARIT